MLVNYNYQYKKVKEQKPAKWAYMTAGPLHEATGYFKSHPEATSHTLYTGSGFRQVMTYRRTNTGAELAMTNREGWMEYSHPGKKIVEATDNGIKWYMLESDAKSMEASQQASATPEVTQEVSQEQEEATDNRTILTKGVRKKKKGTILTSPQGVLTPRTSGRKNLLGE